MKAAVAHQQCLARDRGLHPVPADLPVTLLAGEFLRTGRHGFSVLSEDGRLFGIVSLEDYRRVSEGENAAPEQLTVRDIATRDVVSVFPDETVSTALRRMAPRDLSRLPVVARDDPRRLLGVVRRNDIVRAYEVGALRRAAATPAVSDTRAEFLDVPLAPGAGAVGKTVAKLALPQAAMLVAIRRRRELVIPRGDTCLQAGDVVTALCERECAGEVRMALSLPAQVR